VRWSIATLGAQAISASALEAMSGVGMVSESQALQVPAFAQGVSLISGTCGGMPLWAHKGDYARVPSPQVLAQPDPDIPTSVHWTRVYRDLVLYPYAWCEVLERFSDGFPARMRHVPFNDVNVHKDGIYIQGIRVSDRDVVRFDSPTAPGALINGGRILRTAILVEEAVRRFALFDLPSGALKQTGGPDLLDSEIDGLLSDWEAARQTRNTAFLSPSLDYVPFSFSPEQLQLVAARDAVVKDVARLLNLPPTFVNADTGGGLTYSTVAMQQEGLQAGTLWPYLAAVRDRLSMGDVTPRGTFVEIPSLGFLRTDLTARAQAYQTLLTAGVLTVEEVRVLEQLPPTESDPGRTLP
jgi:phage portal protein BeeE